MKKVICLLVAIIFVFCACSNNELNQNENSNKQTNSIPENSFELENHGVSENTTTTEASSDLNQDQTSSAPVILPIYYDTVDELVKSFLIDFDEEAIQKIEQSEAKNHKGTFRKFTTEIKNNYLYVPFHNGEVVPFLNQSGFYNISLHPSELYGNPWISYALNREKTGVYAISFMLLDTNIKTKAIDNGGSWTIKQIAPDAPNVDNIKSYENYKDIYEKEIETKDQKVQALIYELHDDQKVTILFAYDDVLVRVTSTSDVAYEWMKGLSFQKITID